MDTGNDSSARGLRLTALAAAKAIAALALLALLLGACRAHAAPADTDLVLATTTSTYDTGLLDVLIPDFEARTNYRVKPIAVGTGKALAMGERGEADVLLVHAPPAEKKLLAKGAVVSRELVMHNYFVIVGPPSDPAGIRDAGTASEAMKRIARTESLFMSRGDDSGTHKMELRLWKAAGIEPSGSWHQESGQGMGATLTIASEKSAYTLTDIGTYVALKRNLRLDVLLDNDPSLINIYSVLRVNPKLHPAVNAAGAEDFAAYLVSDAAQALIRDFGVAKFGRPLFTPDAGRDEAELGR